MEEGELPQDDNTTLTQDNVEGAGGVTPAASPANTDVITTTPSQSTESSPSDTYASKVASTQEVRANNLESKKVSVVARTMSQPEPLVASGSTVFVPPATTMAGLKRPSMQGKWSEETAVLKTRTEQTHFPILWGDYTDEVDRRVLQDTANKICGRKTLKQIDLLYYYASRDFKRIPAVDGRLRQEAFDLMLCALFEHILGDLRPLAANMKNWDPCLPIGCVEHISDDKYDTNPCRHIRLRYAADVVNYNFCSKKSSRKNSV